MMFTKNLCRSKDDYGFRIIYTVYDLVENTFIGEKYIRAYRQVYDEGKLVSEYNLGRIYKPEFYL